MRSRARSLADKSIDAILAAVEVYNKPDFAYREECFAILAINAWELLLKARILQLKNNKMSAILSYQRRKRADGTLTDKLYRVKNRSGTYQTVGLFKALDQLRNDYGDKIDLAVRKNLELICEVRDNAVHFFNKGLGISRLAQELGTACLKNYIVLVRQWFAIDMTQYNFFLMPLAFVTQESIVRTISLNADERKLMDFLRAQTQADSNSGTEVGDFNVSLALDIKFSKSKSDSAVKARLSNEPDAVAVKLSEEDVRERYPWDYSILTTRLYKRYADFSANQRYHKIRKAVEADGRYCNKRYLDPAKKTGVGKCFFNPNIISMFDKYYTKKGP